MEPKCPLFTNCGGCSCQHIPYEIQLENKRKLVEDAINNSKIELCADVNIQSHEPYYYRNRMDFVFSKDGPAFRKKGSWYSLVPVKDCAISNKKLNALLKEVQALFNNGCDDAFDMKRRIGTLKYAVIRTPEFTDDSSISFMLNSDSTRINEAVEKIKEFAKKTEAKNIIVSYSHRQTDISTSSEYFVIKGEDKLNEKIAGNSYSFSVQGFMQNNSNMAEKMVKHAKEIFKKHDTKDAFLLDLYGGVGLFGIGLAKEFNEILVVESHEGSIESAKENIKANNLSNADAKCIDAKSIRKLDLPDKDLFVLTDPPRSGMHSKTIQYLLAEQPKVIVYVSCNPKQLGKELVHFKNKYKITSATAFDLFPQTNHVEAIIELQLK